jgi:hypothetical protein
MSDQPIAANVIEAAKGAFSRAVIGAPADSLSCGIEAAIRAADEARGLTVEARHGHLELRTHERLVGPWVLVGGGA